MFECELIGNLFSALSLINTHQLFNPGPLVLCEMPGSNLNSSGIHFLFIVWRKHMAQDEQRRKFREASVTLRIKANSLQLTLR